MAISKGDRVVATEPIPFVITSVPKGTKGTVTRIGGLFSPRYVVEFENGRTEECTDKQVAPI